MTPPPLPIDDALPALLSALRDHRRAVLQAPPGAGKTTRVPLALLQSGLVKGRILMLEPRRLAARAAAERMAETLGEAVGATVGYRMRGESRVSAATRIEVVTEGILTRMIQQQADLPGIDALIFDEFHERSLNADLGLALAWDLREGLRPDLALLVMSATLDAAPVAAMLGNAPLVTSEGRAFPVETRWLPRPLPPDTRLETAVAAQVRTALEEHSGGVLVFLPGEGEIRRVAALLDDLPGDISVRPLFGAMDFAAQRATVAPVAHGRKVVLSTAIAETALTIQDIRVVIDAGKARRARFDPSSGMTRLVTERVSRAEAEQRRGRAGRVAEGFCYRMWAKGEEGALAAFPPAEIEAADLTGLALELAQWGADPATLAFLTQPNPGALAEARGLLTGLGALDDAGRVTAHGRGLASLPLHPRLGHMLALAGKPAAVMAALLAERDPLPRGAGADLVLRVKALDHPGTDAHRGTVERIRAEAKRLGKSAPDVDDSYSTAEMAALAYPDRIGLRRAGDAARYVLSGGKGAVVETTDPLARERLIVATDLDGDPREARVRQGIALSESELRRLYADRIGWQNVVEWSRREGRVLARKQERFGALVLADRPLPEPDPADMARAALDGLRQTGLNWSEPARRLRARAALLHDEGADIPNVADAAILGREDWLLPHLARARTEAELRGLDLSAVLRDGLGWAAMQEVDRLAPAGFITPLGRSVPIDYEGDHPTITLRIQEVFGVTAHPTVGPKRLPLRMVLLSPGQKPIQVTMDLPGFWRSSYADVRKDMRGRYPRHPWPEDPTIAEPTMRAKPRGT